MRFSPEQFVARLGYAELLLFSNEALDTPVFKDMKPKHIIRAKEYDLMPRFEANMDEDIIIGLPERVLFGVKPVTIEGKLSLDLAATTYGSIEYPIAMLFDKLRQGWVGYRSNGAIMSPRDDIMGTTSPLFALGSATHGSFIQCLVDSLDINISKADDPIEMVFGIKSTNYSPDSVHNIQAWQDIIYSIEEKQERYRLHARRMILGKDCTISTNDNTTGSNPVIGNFAMPDRKTSVFARGANNPTGNITNVISMNISFENHLEPIYTCHSHQETDLAARFQENIFPDSYGPSSPRTITGTLEWFGNVQPHTFLERITGPTSLQSNRSLIIDTKMFKIELKNPIWSLSEKRIGLDLVKRTAKFTVASDGNIIVPGYTSTYTTRS